MRRTPLAPGDERALVDHWLQGLGRRTRVALRLDEEGGCTIGHESGLDCVVEVPGNGSLYLRVGLLPWEPEQFPDMAERCLLGSFMGMDTGGAAFGVDPADGELMLWIERPLAVLDEAAFCLLVAHILDNAARWQESLLAAEEKDAREKGEPRRAPDHLSWQKA